MKFKLTELYNTRFFYVTYKKDLTYLFSTCVSLQKDNTHQYNEGNEMLGKVYSCFKYGSPVEFDLAGAKLTPDTSDLISSYTRQGLVFVDTADMCRNAILAENRRRIAIDKSQFVPMPDFIIDQGPVEYIKSLSTEVTYNIPLQDEDLYIPLTYMVMVTRPSVKICIDDYARALFKFVGDHLTVADLMKYDEFYFSTLDGVSIIRFVNGKTLVQKLGEVSIEQAITLGNLVPTVFGSVKLLQRDGDKCWQAIFKECLGVINRYSTTRKVTIRELLERSDTSDN